MKKLNRIALLAKRELARRHMADFVQYVDDRYYMNWHHRLLCDYLDRFVAGEIKNLMVFMPPRHGKSELVSRKLPAYIFGRDPDASIISCSYSADLAGRMNRDVQRIIDSPSYAEIFPSTHLFGKNIRSVANGTFLRNSDIFEIVDHRGVYRSTGVGGGIIVNGEILNGATGAGGEIGHIHIQDGEEDACGCGNHGCLEQYASATGVVRLAGRILGSTDEDSVLRQGEVSAKAVFDAVKAGDAVAVRIAEAFGEYLGKGLAAIAGVVNPEAFVIGGGVSKAGNILFDYIEKNYKKYVFHGSKDAKFELATLGNDAGICGAAKLILE